MRVCKLSVYLKLCDDGFHDWIENVYVCISQVKTEPFIN